MPYLFDLRSVKTHIFLVKMYLVFIFFSITLLGDNFKINYLFHYYLYI